MLLLPSKKFHSPKKLSQFHSPKKLSLSFSHALRRFLSFMRQCFLFILEDFPQKILLDSLKTKKALKFLYRPYRTSRHFFVSSFGFSLSGDIPT